MARAVVFALASLALVVGAVLTQGPRSAVFSLAGCALAGALLLVVARSRSSRR